MAGGGFVDSAGAARAHLYEYRITPYFIFACIVAAMGGSLFGYDLGVSGNQSSSFSVGSSGLIRIMLSFSFWVFDNLFFIKKIQTLVDILEI